MLGDAALAHAPQAEAHALMQRAESLLEQARVAVRHVAG